MDIKEIIRKMTFDEKAKLLTGAESMRTESVEKFGIKSKKWQTDLMEYGGVISRKIVRIYLV